MKMNTNLNGTASLNFPPVLQNNLQELLAGPHLGMAALTINDISPVRDYIENDALYSYHYVLKIPYAGKRLSWELIFDPENLTFAPDFEFNDEIFLKDFDVEAVESNVPSWRTWDPKNPKSLRSIIEEFLNLYQKFQVEKLRKENMYSLISREYNLLIEGMVESSDVEISVEPSTVHFFISMEVDTSSLPQYCQPTSNSYDDLLNPGEDKVGLKVSFMKLDCSRVNVSLQLSPRLEQILGSSKALHIPPYTNQTTLVEYVNLISKLLQNLVEKVKEHHRLKREYINYLSTVRASSMVEYDATTFTKALFLCGVDDDYHCLVHIEIGDKFPEQKPLVTLHSVYCGLPKKPCHEVVDSYPYSPRWSPEEMLKRLIAHLADAISKFKNHKH